MNKKLYFLLSLLLFCSLQLSAQAKKSKSKKPDPATLKIDSLNNIIRDYEQYIISLNTQISEQKSELEQQRTENEKLANSVKELNKTVETQNNEIKKLKESINSKPAEQKPDNNTVMSFESTELNFGEVKEGAAVTMSFKVTNIGKKRLLIEKALGSCGCTVADWPNYPLEPGEKAEIKVIFNSLGKRGAQTKTITVTANTDPAQTILTIKGTVIPSDK